MTKREWALLIQCAIRVQAVLVTVPSVAHFAFRFITLVNNLSNGSILFQTHSLLSIIIPLLIDLSVLSILWIVSPYFAQWLVFNSHERKSVTPLFNWLAALIAVVGIYQLLIVFSFADLGWMSFSSFYRYSELPKTIIKTYFCLLLISRIFFGVFCVVSCDRIAGWLGEMGKARKLTEIEDQK